MYVIAQESSGFRLEVFKHVPIFDPCEVEPQINWTQLLSERKRGTVIGVRSEKIRRVQENPLFEV